MLAFSRGYAVYICSYRSSSTLAHHVDVVLCQCLSAYGSGKAEKSGRSSRLQTCWQRKLHVCSLLNRPDFSAFPCWHTRTIHFVL